MPKHIPETWECLICHSKHYRQSDARCCEKGHKTEPVVADLYHVNGGYYPKLVSLKFEDGESLDYRLASYQDDI